MTNILSSVPVLSQSLLEAYRQTHYYFSDVVLNIDKPSAKAEHLLKPFIPNGGLFITAWNPMGQPVDPASNKLANEDLKKELLSRGFNVVEGYGEHPDESWREDSLFVFPIDKQTSIDLCCSYLQNAVVYVTYEGMPLLLLHPEHSEYK